MQTVTYRPASPALAGLIFCLFATVAFGVTARHTPAFGWIALAFAGVAMLCAWRLIAERDVRIPLLEILPEGVRVHPPGKPQERLFRWEILTRVEGLKIDDSPDQLVFHTLTHRWNISLPSGTPKAETLADWINSARPPHAAPLPADDPVAALESAFSLRLPPGASIREFEKHPDGTARWTLNMPREVFEPLRPKLHVGRWYPLPPDMRFEVGGAFGLHGAPAGASYALGDLAGDNTPVLLHAGDDHRLVALLARSMR